MKSQKEKMLGGELYDPLDSQLCAERRRARLLFKALNDTADDQQEERARLIKELIPASGEGVWNEAHMKGDAKALDELWADDLVVTVPGMAPMTKTQSLAIWKSGKFKFERYQTSDVRIKVYGDAAVVTGHLQRVRTIGDRKAEDDWLFTKFYVRAKGGWQVVAFHASVAPQENK